MWPWRSTICGSAARTVRQTPEHVDLEDPFPLLAADPARGRHLLLGDAGVGDDDVEPAEALDRLGDALHHRRRGR